MMLGNEMSTQFFLYVNKNYLKIFLSKVLVLVLVIAISFTDIVNLLLPQSSPLSNLLEMERAYADSGDFSIFRNNANTSALTTSALDVPWDTTVFESSGIQLQIDDSSINLEQAGKYLVLYNVWASDNAGVERRSIETYLTLDGSRLAYGGGAGYVRDFGGDLDSYNSGAAIIEATAGQDLNIVAVRDDAEASAVAIRAAKNGVSVLRMKDDFDYLRLYKTIDTSNVDINTTFTDVIWDENDEVDTGSFAFTNGSGDVTLKGLDGDYFLVTTNIRLKQTANSNNRLNYELVLTLDGVEIPGSKVTTYIRGNSNSDGAYTGTLAYSGIIRKNSSSDEVLNIEVRKESIGTTANTDIIASKTALSIAALPNTGHYISLTSTTSSQDLTTTRTAFNWNEQFEVDTAAFSHSTTTNNTRINFDTAGDYLFFSTVYSSRTSGSVRSSPVIEWNLDGLGTALLYGGHGGYNRGDQGSNDAFTAGSSGGLILNGITDTQYLELTRVDEAASTNPVFQPRDISIQGVKLSELFITYVDVSATGTHSVEYDIASTNLNSGGGFVIESNGSTETITSIRITESGTVDAQDGLSNVELWYDLDETFPYDCTGEFYDGDESQFEVASKEFSGADGSVAFTGSVQITTTKSLCAYTVYDVVASSTDGQTIQISIDNPTTDVTISGSPSISPSSSVSPAASTILRNAELTQTHYNWRNDNGSETTATSIEGVEDVPSIGFTNGTIRRLRLGVSAEGSTSSPPIQYRLEYAQKLTTCSAVVAWTDVGVGGGGDWDIVNSPNLTDGNDTTNVALQVNGGVTDPGGSFLSANAGQKDTSSQTGNITFTSGQFAELEYAIEPTISASQGNTYCFRVSDAGTGLRNYDVYAEGTISADIDVSASSTHAVSLDVGSANQYVGGSFVIERPGGTRTVTDITITEIGTIDALNDLSNIELLYDLDTTAPYDCTGESYGGGETSFGSPDIDGFSAANGTSIFTGSETLDNTRSMCVYVMVDIGAGASDGETIEIQISDPSTDVIVTGSSVGPSTAVSPDSNVTLVGPVLTQTHYHWRNDDGNEAGATSASGDVEDSAILNIAKETTYRLRLQVSNLGFVSSPATTFRLEYGTKLSTCTAIALWTDVGVVGGAWDMSLSSNIADGDTTDVALNNLGAMTDENTSFIGTGALRETTSDSGAIALSSVQFTELEYSIEATVDSGYNTNYCFRVSDSGADLKAYTTYAELTTREKQDFFIQRGNEDVSGTGMTLIAGVDYTAPTATSSAFVRITNSQLTGAGNNIGGGTQNADDVTAYISDQSDITSSFTITRPATAINTTRVSWEIIEFVGLAGSDNEMKVKDVGELSVASTNFFATGTVATEVVDDTDIAVFITGQLNPSANTTNFNDSLFTASWNSSTNEPVFQRGDADVTVEISYAVVEFSGANWQVQRTEHNYTDAGVAETESITAIPNVSQGFIHAQKRVGEGLQGLDENGHQVWLSSIGAVSFRLRAGAGAPADHNSVAWVISNTQSGNGSMVSHRSNGAIASGGTEPVTNSITIGSTINTSNSSIFATNDSNGAGTAFPRPINGFSIASTTHYEIWQSDTGQNIDFHVEVVEWPVAETSIRQNYYRFYVDNDAIDPTDPWPAGASDLGENTSVTSIDDPLGESERIRIRMSLLINNATLPENIKSFKLQYGLQLTTCNAVSVWNDVGGSGGGEIWRGYNASPSDGTELATSSPAAGTLNISVSDVAGTYEEFNNSAINPYSVDIGDDVEYDWLIEHNGATQRSDYCFRMINSDDSELDGYFHYPTLRTTGYTPISHDWRWYDDEVNDTPSTPLATENVAPVDIANKDVLKLRVISSEVENAAGFNTKFSLQYSQYADFSDGGTAVVAQYACVASSTWCYSNGGGIDNAIIQSKVLFNTDACLGGVGNGCGTHNEIATTTTAFTHVALADTEFEFTIENAAARANGVYYFRLYDETAGQALVASSTYPSLVTEGPQLVSTISGVTIGTSVAGIVADVETTPTSIGFGSLPFGTTYEAIQRIAINTNATEGYQLLMYATQQLTNSYGDIIPAITSTNASPSGWATACSGSATGCVGYHTTDATLAGGSGRFAPIDSYAALDITPQELMYSSIPANDVHDIVYRILVTEEQVAGDYQTNIVYLSIPVF